MKQRLQRYMSDDSGVALITVLGVGVVITLLAVGAFNLTQQALLETSHVEDETRAYRAAASGLDLELATFQEKGLTETYPKTGSTPDGTFEIYYEPIGASRYRLVSEGTGIDGSTETVAQEFYFLNLWKMNFAGGTKDTLTNSAKLTGNSNIVGPFYMKGDLNITASMGIQEGPLFVYDGSLTRSVGGAGFGTAAAPVDVFCEMFNAEAQDKFTAKGGGVYIGNVDLSCPELDTPELSKEMMEGYASTAMSESVDNKMGSATSGSGLSNYECDASIPSASDYDNPVYTGAYSLVPRTQAHSANANYKFIGNKEGIIGDLGEGKHDFTISADTPSFGWWGPVNAVSAPPTGTVTVASQNPTGVYPENVHDDFAWDQANKTLYVEGTVFIDGDLTLATPIEYVGNGTLVVNGDVEVLGTFRPVGESIQAWENEWVVGIVSPTTIDLNPADAVGLNAGGNLPDPVVARTRKPDLGGAFFASDSIMIQKNTLVQGSIVTGIIEAPKNNLVLVTNPLLPEYLPDSLPGSAGGLMTPTRWMRY